MSSLFPSPTRTTVALLPSGICNDRRACCLPVSTSRPLSGREPYRWRCSRPQTSVYRRREGRHGPLDGPCPVVDRGLLCGGAATTATSCGEGEGGGQPVWRELRAPTQPPWSDDSWRRSPPMRAVVMAGWRACRGRGEGPLRARPLAGCHSPPCSPTAPPRPRVWHEASRPPRPTDPLYQNRPIHQYRPAASDCGAPAKCHRPPRVRTSPPTPPRIPPAKRLPKPPADISPQNSPWPRAARGGRQERARSGGPTEAPPPPGPPRPATTPPPLPRPGSPHPRGRGRPHLAPAVVTNTTTPAGPRRVSCDHRP